MKGILKNKEGKWSIEYWDKLLPPNEIRSVLCELPLHPDSINGIEEPTDWVAYYYGREVEFEIVDETLSNLDGDMRKNYKFAKLIQSEEDYFKSVREGITQFTKQSGYSVYIPEDAKKQEETTTWEQIRSYFKQFHKIDEKSERVFNWFKENYNPPVKK